MFISQITATPTIWQLGLLTSVLPELSECRVRVRSSALHQGQRCPNPQPCQFGDCVPAAPLRLRDLSESVSLSRENHRSGTTGTF